MVHVLALDLLRGHVVRRAQKLPFLGQVRGVHPGDAEIGDLDPVVGRDQDVRRLDVAVDDAVGVRIVEGIGHLGDDVHHERQRQRLVPLEKRIEVRPAHILHGDEGAAVLALLHHVVDGDDVGMAEECRRSAPRG